MNEKLFAVFILLLSLALNPAHAEMFDDDYKPCGNYLGTPEIMSCVADKIKKWDKRLNAAYDTLMHYVDPAQREPLKKAENLWIKYRQINCEFYGAQDGTIKHIKEIECIRAMTQARTLELEEAAKP